MIPGTNQPGSSVSPRPRPRGDRCPPKVLRGAKSHPRDNRPPLTASLDWIRVVVPIGLRDSLSDYLSSLFACSPESCGGRYMMRSGGRRWSDYAGVYWDSERAEAVIDIWGGGCSHLGPDAVAVLRTLTQHDHARVTRLDLAIDRTDAAWSHLIPAARVSCLAGELLGARRWKTIEERSGSRLVNDGVAFGCRGNMGSGRYLRIYDKGLEQRSDEQGVWVRWELECTGDLAGVAAAFVLREDHNSTESIMQFAFGSVEFRKVTGRRDRDRRPLVPWYEDLIRGLDTVRPTIPREPASAASWLHWAGVAVAQQVCRVADAMQMPVRDLLERLIDTERESDSPWLLGPAVVAELRARRVISLHGPDHDPEHDHAEDHPE